MYAYRAAPVTSSGLSLIGNYAPNQSEVIRE